MDSSSKLAFASALLAVAGIAAVAFLSRSVEPRAVELGALGPRDEGSLVRVFGVVRGAGSTKGGSFLLCAGSSCARVLSGGKFGYGQAVVVEGIVKADGGSFSISPFGSAPEAVG